jgi:hypothetical protein
VSRGRPDGVAGGERLMGLRFRSLNLAKSGVLAILSLLGQ